jgi:nucleoside-diphosphate-sugar epimerase
VSITHRQADLRDPEQFISAIRAAQPDTVLHLAWSASGSPDYRNSSDNSLWVSASAAAAAHCLKEGIRFIGTGTVIDDRAPTDAYSRSKSELRQRLAEEIKGRMVTWLRPFYVFDPVAARPALLADAFDAMSHSRPVRLQSPETRHDFVHAADVGAAIVAVVIYDLHGSIDIGSGCLRSVADLVEACGAAWQGGAPRNPSTHSAIAANLTALRATGWRATATEEFFRLPPRPGTKSPSPTNA